MLPLLKKVVEVLPECYIKYRLIARYRWPFLERERRDKVMDAIIMREFNRCNIHVADLLTDQKNRKERIFTVPTINLIENLVYEYGCQIGLFTEISPHMALYRMSSMGIINSLLMNNIKSLYEIRDEILSTFFYKESSESDLPVYYLEANRVLRMLEEALCLHYQSNFGVRPFGEFTEIVL